MREVLFRAKRINWYELPKEEWWVEGYLFDDGFPKPKHYFVGGIIVKPYIGTADDEWDIVGIDFYEIDPETLCQFTGMTDKNGRMIWENDILKGFTYPFFCDGEFNYFATVEWSEKNKYFFLYTIKNPNSTVRGISEGNGELFESFNSDDWEVIGNTFDTLELVKK